MSVTIYGIKNCDTMKKAFAWLDARGIAYTFHDYRKHGIDADTLARWCAALGWDALVNTRGTTWRKLDPAEQAIGGAEDAIRVMQAHTSVIRRPVIETTDGALVAGLDLARLETLFAAQGETR